jgi:TetR/AcrR family transcriptional regulator, repressor of fatR-cypB operon
MAAATPAREDTGKRQAILDAALELFSERGFHGTAVPLVAEKAGVGAGTVYRYFESKEALVNALYQACKETMGRVLLAGLTPGAEPREQFHALWGRLAAFAREHPRALNFLELHHHAPYLDEASRMLDQAVVGPARAYVLDAQTRKVLKPLSPDLLIALVFGAFIGIAKGCAEGKITMDPETLEAAEECVWHAIRR